MRTNGFIRNAVTGGDMKTKWKIAAVLALGLGTAAPGWAALQDSLTIT